MALLEQVPLTAAPPVLKAPAHGVSSGASRTIPILTITEDFHTACRESTVCGPYDWLHFVPPVFGVLVEVCHTINAHLQVK